MDLNTNMLRLGPIQFKHAGISFSNLSRKDDYRWGNIDLLNRTPAQQAMGIGSKSITLSGVIFPHYDPTPNVALNTYIGINRIHDVRRYAELQQPFILSDGLGRVYGRWVIKSVQEEQSNFLVNGIPQKQSYTIELMAYDDSTDYNLVIDDRTKRVSLLR